MATTDVATLDDLDSKIAGLKVEVERCIADAVKVLRAEIAALRDELRSEIAALRDELRSEIAELRDELRSEIAELRGEIAEVRSDVSRIEGLLLEVLEHVRPAPSGNG